jgi:hypothetical protein
VLVELQHHLGLILSQLAVGPVPSTSRYSAVSRRVDLLVTHAVQDSVEDSFGLLGVAGLRQPVFIRFEEDFSFLAVIDDLSNGKLLVFALHLSHQIIDCLNFDLLFSRCVADSEGILRQGRLNLQLRGLCPL